MNSVAPGVERIAGYDRPAAIISEEEHFNRRLSEAQSDCNMPSLTASIDWSIISDVTLRDEDVSLTYCAKILDVMGGMCGDPSKANLIRSNIQSVQCQLVAEDAQLALELSNSLLSAQVPIEISNLRDKLRTELEALPTSGGSIGQNARAESARVCADEAHEKFIVLTTNENQRTEIAFGSREALTLVRETPPIVSEGSFYEPRYLVPDANTDFRGINMQYYSRVEARANTCSLTCGERRIDLSVVDGDLREGLLALTPAAPAFDREPHALARDRRGIYYYVDRQRDGSTSDFRLFSGRRGAMEPLEMRDIVSDSQGEIFESTNGTLRLLLDEDDDDELKALWISGRRQKELRRLPVEENLNVIFNELGVYLGERLGTPCDDF